MLVALAGVGPGVALMAVGMESIKGVGRTRLLHWVTLVSTAIGIGLLFLLQVFNSCFVQHIIVIMKHFRACKCDRSN